MLRHYWLKFIVYIRVHLCVIHYVGLNKYIMTYQPLQYHRRNPGMTWECHFSGSIDTVKLVNNNNDKKKNYICCDQEELLSSYLQRLTPGLYIASVQWSKHWCKRNDFSLAFSMLEMKATLCRLSVQLSLAIQLCPTLQLHGLQYAWPPCPSPTPGIYSNSCPLSWWCHPTISSSVIPFFSCLQSFQASGSFPMHQLLASGGQSIGVSDSTSVLPMNIQDLFPLG